MTQRIETRPGWQLIAHRIRDADLETRAHCLRTLATRALNELAQRNYDTLELQMDSSTTLARLRQLAEAADDQYLKSLDNNDGDADDEVMDQFSIARALAALVFARVGDGANEILESAYELAVISPEVEQGLLSEMTAAVAQ